MASKPKQVRLSLEQKGVVLKKSDGGIRANRLAIEFGVSESAISQIKSKRKEILNALSNSYEEVKKKKTLPKADQPEMEKQIYDWFLVQRERNCAISGTYGGIESKSKRYFQKIVPRKNNRPNIFQIC